MDFDSFDHESHMITFAILVEINGFINAVIEKTTFRNNVKVNWKYLTRQIFLAIGFFFWEGSVTRITQPEPELPGRFLITTTYLLTL